MKYEKLEVPLKFGKKQAVRAIPIRPGVWIHRSIWNDGVVPRGDWTISLGREHRSVVSGISSQKKAREYARELSVLLERFEINPEKVSSGADLSKEVKESLLHWIEDIRRANGLDSLDRSEHLHREKIH